MTPAPEGAKPRRRARSARVVAVSNVTPHMIRVVLGGPGLDGFSVGEFTDHYVKLVLPPVGADYAPPFDPDEIRESRPRELWPVMRTYTVRDWDAEAGELTLDFVYHGDEGVAGPWAAAAKPGDEVSLQGPGGGYAPDPTADWHLFVGDESALPAIAVALDRLDERARALAVIEVENADERQQLPTSADATVTWVLRDEAPGAPGEELVRVVKGLTFPSGRVHAFVHGDAGFVREVRRYLRGERGVAAADLSASGYWRRGRTDEAWRAEKAEWKAQVESDDSALSQP